MYKARLFLVLTAWGDIVEASPELKFRDRQWNRYRSNVVSAYRQLASRDISFLSTSSKWPHSMRAMRTRHYLFWINAECVCHRLFHYSVFFPVILIYKNIKILIYVIIINIGYEYFCFEIFFSRIYPQSLLVYSDKTDSLCIRVMKNMICNKRSKLDFRLVWYVRYTSLAHTAHITLDVKSLISSPHRIMHYYIFLWNLRYLIEVLKCFLDSI